MQIDTTIFKDYDIRGVYPTQLNAAVAEAIAYAVVRKFAPQSVAICRDMRLSGEELKNAFVNVFTRLGINVTDLGLGGTEITYFVAGTQNYDLVLMISASHNPPEYNGLKLVKKGPVAITGESGMFAVRDLITEGPLPAAPKPGSYTTKDVFPEWREKVRSLVDTTKLKLLSVAIDAGNGMAGKLAPFIFDDLPLTITKLFFELDGSFPNHIPNPLVEENTKALKAKIIETHADVGLTFDGDADRMFLVDDKGRMVSGTITTALLARYILEKHPGEMILYNAICGRIVPKIISQYGGKSKRVRVGHSFIKTYMRETNAIFAGEHSGHYYFRDFFRAESGVLTGLMILSLLSQENKKLSQLVDELNIYPASGEINFKVPDIPRVMDAIRTGFPDAQAVDKLDGISVWYPDYWFNVRGSKTEPLLRLNVEADTKELLAQKTAQLTQKISSLGGQKK